MKYRPDIEGMRALAIMLVVAAHARVPGFEAGYVGVDIFFVISGYLISGLLIAEKRDTGRIDIAAFYARRFRRLLPALLLLLLATAAATMILLPPQEQPYQASAGAAASIWASNLYFAFQRIDYFASGAESNVFLHTWSLGVEEQFYLVWPWLILLLAFHRSSDRRSKLAWGMTAILVASLLACVWVTQASPRHAFYLMPFRAWQFAAGALTCMLGARIAGRKHQWNRSWMADASGFGGMILVFLALVTIRPEATYPGLLAVIPTLGAILLLFAASVGESLVTRALALAPMQAIGRLSYGWYLWHWPMLVLGVLLLSGDSLVRRLELVLAALALAAVSYRLVERPLRQNSALIHQPSRFILASLMVMLGLVLMFLRWGEAAQTQSQATTTGAGNAITFSTPVIYSMGCDDWYRSDRLNPCLFGSDSAPKTAVAIGDSIGLQWFPAYVRVFASPKWRLIVLTKSSCPMVDSPIFNKRIMREFTECARWRDRVLDYIAQLRPDVVVMGTTHTADFSRDAWIKGTERVLSRIAPSSGEIYIMRSTPLIPFNGPACVWSHVEGKGANAEVVACSAPAADVHNDEVAEWLGEASHSFGNVHMLDMNDDVCPDGVCSAMRKGMLTYRDNQHLTAGYAEDLADALKTRIDAFHGGAE